MAIVPETNQGKIDFYSAHVTPWTTNGTAIGLATGDGAALGALVTTATAAAAAQRAAQNAAKAATVDYNSAVTAMTRKGSELIAKIKAKAAGSTTPDSIYSLAQIPSPATPTPVGAPGTPTDLKVTLNPDGSLDLAWKCVNPAGSVGTIYNLRRKNATATAFTAIGGTGTREFTDDTVPAGVASVVYEITAVRSTREGTAAQFIVNFGVASGGEAVASVLAAPKLAA